MVTGHKAWAGNELHQVESWQLLTLEKSDSLGTKLCRKRLWDYLEGRKAKQAWRDLVRNVNSLDCSGDSKVLAELQIAIRSKILF